MNKQVQIEKATERVNAYVAKLRHGASFKYVKGLTREQKLLANICLDRQRNGKALELTNEQMEAFNLTPTTGLGMAFIVDITVFGKLTIVPFYGINK